LKIPLTIEDKTLSISEETWIDLKSGKDSTAYSSVKAAATAFVAADGNFVIQREQENDSSVINHFHRRQELQKFFDNVDQERAEKGL